MKFDRFNDTPTAAEAQMEVLPDGDHVCGITDDKEWSAQDGSRSATIVTFSPVSGHPAVTKFLDPADERDDKIAKQLLAACGLEPTAELGLGELVGERVTITTKRAVTRDGEPVMDKRTGLQRVYVNAVKPAPAAAKAAAPKAAWEENREREARAIAKRTAHQKAKAAAAQAGDDDGIPF